MYADIVVIGSLNMDLVVTAQRAPDAGETVAGDKFQTIPGGKGANQAVAVAKAGGNVGMIGCVGADDFGTQLKAALTTSGVDTTHIRTDEKRATGVASIVVEATGENRILVVAGANGRLTPNDITDNKNIIQQAKMVVLQLEIPLETVAAALSVAHEANVPTLLNAAPAYPLADALLAQITYLVVNETEAQLLSGVAVVDGATAQQAAEKLREKGITAVILTLGTQGVFVANDTHTAHIPSYPVTAVDTTAAGDSFIGALTTAIVEGKSLVDAAHWGNAAGALTVTKLGAQYAIPQRHAIEAFINST